MKALIRVFPLVLVFLFLSAAVGVAAGEKPVSWTSDQMKWVASPALKGLSVATLWGDPQTGAYGALKKVAAGTDIGWHTHSFDQKTVGISGVFDFQVQGGPKQQLGPGAYSFTPANVVHRSTCRAGADCVYFEEQPGKSDYKPAPAPKM